MLPNHSLRTKLNPKSSATKALQPKAFRESETFLGLIRGMKDSKREAQVSLIAVNAVRFRTHDIHLCQRRPLPLEPSLLISLSVRNHKIHLCQWHLMLP